jgi:hypothetical protein
MAKKERWGDLDANQWFLSINLNPMAWMNDKIIKIGSSGGQELLTKAKADENGYTSMMNLFVSDGQGCLVLFWKTILIPLLEKTSRTKQI